MKKYFYLIVLMSNLATPLFGDHIRELTKTVSRWDKMYSLHKMDKKTLLALSEGLSTLMRLNPNQSDNVSEQLYTLGAEWKNAGLHPDCYNALVKACGETVLTYTEKAQLDKNTVWRSTLREYYNQVQSTLATKLGSDVPQTSESSFLKELPEVDSVVHNLRRPEALRIAPKKRKVQHFVQVVIVSRSV